MPAPLCFFIKEWLRLIVGHATGGLGCALFIIFSGFLFIKTSLDRAFVMEILTKLLICTVLKEIVCLMVGRPLLRLRQKR